MRGGMDNSGKNKSDKEPTAIGRVLRWIIEEFSTIIVLVSASTIAIANRLGKWNDLAGPALFAIFIALSVRVLQMKYQISGVSKTVDQRADNILSDFGSLRRSVESDRLHEAEMCDRPAFYGHMLSALRDVEKSVDLTNLDSYPPGHYGTPAMVEYFQLQTRTVRERPDMRFRRIVSIPTLEKLEWTLDILDQVAECPNFQINVIDMSATSALPPPLSLQIFDRKEMCLVDPTLGFMLPEDQRHMLWVKGVAVSNVFSIYYDSLWSLARRVKEGSIIYGPVLLEIQRDLSAKFPEKRALSRKLAPRINQLSGRIS
jgi:hypothetical protein